jgi:hypothetical protein
MKEEFMKNKFILLKNVIDPRLLKFIEPYFLYNQIKNPDSFDIQVTTAHSFYGDPMTETLLLKLNKTVEDATGLKLFPTYSYYRNYRKGDILHPHIDRPACEISATLCLGYSYSDLEYSWPIFVNGIGYDLKPGDMAIYRGLECPHWRNKFDPPGSNDYQIQTFLHYVDANGPHAEWIYDKRIGIGHVKKHI